ICYSPPPKRRDHHPARRGWLSPVGSCAGSAGAGARDGWLGLAGGASGACASARKLTFSRTVERRRAARSASCALSVSADARAAFARLAAAAAPAPPALAAMAIGTDFAFARFAGRLLAGQSLGFVRLDFGFVLQVERVVVEGFLRRWRRGCGLGRQQRFGRFQRMHLLAAIDDERLLAADRGVGHHRERHLEAVLEIAQTAALV